MIPTARLRVGMAILAASLLAACGGSNPSSGASSPSPTPSKSANLTVSDTCQLVTADDASTAVGTPVTSAAAGASVPNACIYTSADGTAAVIVFAQAYPDTSTADQVQPNQIAAYFQGQYGITNAHAVSGVGDKAFEYTVSSSSGSPGSAIFVWKANVLLFIIISPSTDTTKLETLAKSAVGKLHG